MWEKYEKIKKIGEGGMAEVWLVRNKMDRKLFAAKYLSNVLTRDKDKKRFIREANILKKINHANIIKIYELSEASEKLGYVMDYCPEGNISKYCGSNDKKAICKILKELVSAVDYLHTQNFIHRDIKPNNILISPSGEICLSDFGLAVSSKLDREVITTSNWFSSGFAAPEQYNDMKSVTAKTDIFAIGATLYNLLTDSLFDIQKPIEDQLKRFLGLERFLLENTLNIDPVKRFKGASEIGTAINEFPIYNLKKYFSFKEDYKKIKFIDETFQAGVKAAFEGKSIVHFIKDLEVIKKYEWDRFLKALAQEHIANIEVIKGSKTIFLYDEETLK